MNTQLKEADIRLPELPWDPADLEPVISRRTIEFHYGKHHSGYVDKLNKAIAGTKYAGMPLEELIRTAKRDPDLQNVFNNAAQVWNHSFYWDSLTPTTGAPSSALRERLDEDFGGMEKFADKFGKAARGQFGSGWAWLVFRDGKLEIMTTSDADTPVADGIAPLLTLDVWEHAYYLDYQNDRGAHVDAVIEKRLNWAHASTVFERVSDS